MVNCWLVSAFHSRLLRPTILVVAVGLAGCGREDVQVYRVAKEHHPSPQAAPQQHAHAPSSQPAITFNTPPGWQQSPPGEMRAASFRVLGADGKQAEISAVPLPGMVGRDLENVNRWRSTVGLPAVTEEELSRLAQPVPVGDLTAQLFDQGGENPGSGEASRILVAILRREGVAWYFKMAGDDEVVSAQKPAFLSFLKSIGFGGSGAQAQLPPSHPPIDGASPSGAAQAVSAPGGGKPAWEVPSGWQEVPGGQFLLAKFTVSGADNAQASINVSMSPGDGGGLLGNVNRWRGQLGLDPLAEAEVNKLAEPLEVDGGRGMLFDLTGTDARTSQKARLVGVILPQGNRTWFYKLMGHEQVVAREKPAFTRFVQSARYPHAS